MLRQGEGGHPGVALITPTPGDSAVRAHPHRPLHVSAKCREFLATTVASRLVIRRYIESPSIWIRNACDKWPTHNSGCPSDPGAAQCRASVSDAGPALTRHRDSIPAVGGFLCMPHQLWRALTPHECARTGPATREFIPPIPTPHVSHIMARYDRESFRSVINSVDVKRWLLCERSRVQIAFSHF